MDSFADKIILKDGSIEVSDRIWESERYIHFILNGTQGVEIRYAKEIVERIERRKPIGQPSLEKKVERTETSIGKIDVSEQNELKNQAPVTEQGPPAVRHQSLQAPQYLIKENRGVSFYDPRRPMRYWAMRNSKHKKLTSALDAMAKPYDRSAKWVEAHMGQENDLGKIHHNLIRQFQSESYGPDKSGPLKHEKGIRELSLTDGAIEQKKGEMEGDRRTPSSRPQIGSGIRFYDPRRFEKYWSSQTKRHHTLKAALNALAQQYGVTPSWIETHMGDTNDLSIIHLNIQKNLKRK